MPLIPHSGDKGRQVGVNSRPSLQEFQESQGYIEQACLEKPNTNKHKPTKWEIQLSMFCLNFCPEQISVKQDKGELPGDI